MSDIDSIHSFPSEIASSEEKASYDYIMQYAKAMYEPYRYTEGGFARDNKRIILNRKYAEGLQSIDKYKNRFSIEDGDVSYLNLDWSVVPVIPKYVDLWVGEMINQDLSIECDAIDPVSRMAKDDKRKEYLTNMVVKGLNDYLEAEMGFSIIPKGEYIPDNKEELDIHMKLSSKLATEIAMEEAIDFELYASDWEQIKEKLIRDLAVIKKSALKVYFDENNKVKFRYADWANIIVPYSVKDDLSDIRYVGEIIKVPLYEIRRMSKGSLSEEALFDIAKSFAGRNNNRSWNYGSSFHKYYYDNSFDPGSYDDFLIDLLDFTFISINTNVWEKKSNNYGGFYFQPRPSNYELPENSKQKRELVKKDLEYTYKGKWIVNSDYLIDYGLSENILRDKKSGKFSPKAVHPYIFIAPNIYDMQNKSLVERMMPHADQIQLIHLKIQQLLSKLTPPGQAIDINALKDVVLGKGGAWSPLELQELYAQTGVFYHNGIDEEGRPMNRRPIEEIHNSIGNVLQELIGMYNFEIQQIRDVTGLNEVRDASMPDKESAVATQQMALQSSRNVTRSLNYAFRYLFEGLARRLGLMIQYNIGNGINLDLYENVIGHQNMRSINLTKDLKLVEMGIKVRALPDEGEKMLLEQNIQQSLAQKELLLEDAITIRSIPNEKLANQFLTLKRKQYSERKMEEDKARIQAQMQEAQQAAALKSEEEMQKIQIQAQADIMVENNKKEKEAALERERHQFKMEELRLAGEYKSTHIQLASDEEFKNTTLSSTIKQPKVYSGAGGGKPSVAP